MKKRGLSPVIATILIIGLSIILATMIWEVVNNLVDSRLGEAKACYDTFEKLKIDESFTCYDSGEETVNVSISRGNIEIDSLKVILYNETGSYVKEIYNESSIVAGVSHIGAQQGNSEIQIPPKEGKKTYIFSGIDFEVDSIKISPTISGYQCEVSDSLDKIYPCV